MSILSTKVGVPAARIGDLCMAHCSIPIMAWGASRVFVNGRPFSRYLDITTPHLFPADPCFVHVGAIQTGASTVIVQGPGGPEMVSSFLGQAGHVGSTLLACTFVVSGSFDVFVGTGVLSLAPGVGEALQAAGVTLPTSTDILDTVKGSFEKIGFPQELTDTVFGSPATGSGEFATGGYGQVTEATGLYKVIQSPTSFFSATLSKIPVVGDVVSQTVTRMSDWGGTVVDYGGAVYKNTLRDIVNVPTDIVSDAVKATFPEMDFNLGKVVGDTGGIVEEVTGDVTKYIKGVTRDISFTVPGAEVGLEKTYRLSDLIPDKGFNPVNIQMPDFIKVPVTDAVDIGKNIASEFNPMNIIKRVNGTVPRDIEIVDLGIDTVTSGTAASAMASRSSYTVTSY